MPFYEPEEIVFDDEAVEKPVRGRFYEPEEIVFDDEKILEERYELMARPEPPKALLVKPEPIKFTPETPYWIESSVKEGLDILWGIPEGLTGLATGIVGFLGGAISGAAEPLKEMMTRGLAKYEWEIKKGVPTKLEVKPSITWESLSVARQVMEKFMDEVTYKPRTRMGKTIMDIGAAPFETIHRLLEGLLRDQPEDVKEGTKYLVDVGIAALLPKLPAKVKSRLRAKEATELAKIEAKTREIEARETAILEEVERITRKPERLLIEFKPGETFQLVSKKEAQKALAEQRTAEITTQSLLPDPTKIYHIDEIIRTTKQSPEVINSALRRMEIQGTVKRLPDNRWQRLLSIEETQKASPAVEPPPAEIPEISTSLRAAMAVEEARPRIVKPPKPKKPRRATNIVTYIKQEGGLSIEREPALKRELELLREDPYLAFAIRKKGKGLSVDQARQAAIEGGFLPEDAGINEFLEAFQQRKLHPEEAARRTVKQLESKSRRFGRVPHVTAEGEVAYGGIPFIEGGLPKYAEAINLERIDAPYAVRKTILDIAGQYKRYIDERRRGIITHAATRELADQLGLTIETLLKRKKGEAWNAERILAARDLNVASATALRRIMEQAAEEGTPEALVRARRALERHAMIQAEVSGLATEAGRALSAHRIKATGEALAAKNYRKMLEAIGGRELNEAIVERFMRIDPTNLTAVNQFVRDVTKATKKDMVYEVWRNFLLSGPQTHVVNITSTALMNLSHLIAEKPLAAVIDFFRAGPRERFFGEVPAYIYGIYKSFTEGLRKAINVWATEAIPEATRLEFAYIPPKAIPSKVFRRGKVKAKVTIGEKEIPIPLTGEIILGGRQVRVPMRFLMAADEFFKTMAYEGNIYALAYRQAVKEGLKGAQRVNRIAELRKEPPDWMVKEANSMARYLAFQKEFGPLGRRLMRLRSDIPGGRWIIPFTQALTNLVKMAGERSPLNFFRIIHKASKGEIKGAVISDELAKAVLGTAIAGGTFLLASQGKITGRGPTGRTERQALYRAGWRPWSVKIGDKYYYYNRVDPWGIVMGVSASLAELWDDMSEEEKVTIIQDLITLAGRNILDKTYTRGIADTLNAIMEPERYGERWIRSWAGTVVPTGIALWAYAEDPHIRRVESIFDRIQSRIPYYSTELLPRLNLWGEPIERVGGFFTRMVSPFYVSPEGGDKIDHELLRLQFFPGMPSRRIGERLLTPEQHNRYIELAGKKAKAELDVLVESSAYIVASDDEKIDMIRRIIRRTRREARDIILREIEKEEGGV